jgi:hypothetical protein
LALFILLVGGGARNWIAGALLVIFLFWGAFVLELCFGFVRRLIARFVVSPTPGAGADGGTPLAGGWGPGNGYQSTPDDHAAPVNAADTPDAQRPPPYENIPYLEGHDSATPLLSLGGTRGVPSKPVEQQLREGMAKARALAFSRW